MTERLTGAEGQIALIICVVMAAVGRVMAAAGRVDPMGSHGAIVLIAPCITTCFVLRAITEPEPSEDRTVNYYDYACSQKTSVATTPNSLLFIASERENVSPDPTFDQHAELQLTKAIGIMATMP